MIPKKRAKLSLASVFLTFFIDNLCWSIVFPIFAPYFLDKHNALFSSDVSVETRTTILGFFLMAFSLGQFLGAPIVGEYADRHGRKKALIITVLFTLVGLLMTAWSMQMYNLILLFIGRLVTGIFASNTSICLASVTDLSEDEKAKAKNFGYFSVIAGLSFILGAFVGGKLSDPTIDSAFEPDFPIWLASGMTLINLLFVVYGFRETAQIDPKASFDFLECFRNIESALQTERIKRVYAIYFLFLFSWTILFQFIPVVAVRRFGFTGSNIGDLALFMGICWAIGSGYLNKLLIHMFSSLRILEVCLLIFTGLTAFVIFPKHVYGVLAILGLCVVVGSIAWPICNSVISNLAPSQIQGKILGMSQSVQSLAMTLAPAIGGMAFKVSIELPFFIGAGASLIAGAIYFTLKER
jgi:DHA1 family tetracycline resistance protein-like MFS transporter